MNLRWFWNPQERWLLPIRCPRHNEIISADTLALITTEQNASSGMIATEDFSTVQSMHMGIQGTWY